MVSIDLDNIIHYHPAPMSKPPCKPPHLTTSSRGSSHPPSNQPVLMHPLPPRPPCLSHESPQTCHPRRQSPSPAVSSVRRDRDAHLNDFDKELANLEMAEFGSQETPELCFGGTEETQAEDINDIQRKELHDQHGGASHSDDRFTNDSRILSEGPTTPQDTAASSDSPGTDLSSAASAPTCPMEADGSVSPNEPCPLQDPTPTERNETQLSAFGCETDVNIVAAGNVSTDQAPSPNPSTPVPAEDEPEPANQRLFRWSPETGAEYRISSPLPVTEAHSIQLDARDLSATRDSHLEVRSDGNDIHSTNCCPDDEASEGKDPLRDLSRSCSVSVVVPVTRSRGLPITRSTRSRSTRYTGKRQNRANSACTVESDDPDDSDYTDGNDSGVGDITRLPRRDDLLQRRSSPLRLDVKARIACSPRRPRNRKLQIHVLPQVCRTYKPFLSEAFSLGKPRASRFLPDEDDRLIELKEERGLPWSRIVKHFPGRTKVRGLRTEELEVPGKVGMQGLHILQLWP
ncbi:hypothetical protein N7524_009024 [Penicillium chrysogenum]|nr:hypothetical protein N7524_009024 [Penicillium chrysogenum]